jgi:hypothetical protein
MYKINWPGILGLQALIMTSSFGLFAVQLTPLQQLDSLKSDLNQIEFAATRPAQPSKSSTDSSVLSADQIEAREADPSLFSVTAEVSQSRNLVDFQDGSREDATELLLVPSYKTKIGKFSAKIQYAQNQTNSEDINNGFADALLTYTYPALDWDWSPPYVIFISPGFTLVAPISKVSQKQTELQTATIFNFTLGVKPDDLFKNENAWSFLLGLTAGRNFHPYEEDINGVILNKYSSNQSITINYSYSAWSLSLDFINRSRWTYKDNIKQSFIANQEIGYEINPNLNFAIGHTNEASALKADGQSSNLNFSDEKTSTVFATIGVNF